MGSSRNHIRNSGIELKTHIEFVIDAHQNHPVKTGADLRYWDMKTPYVIHPIWCAMTILTETKLENQIRNNGVLALLYHDVLEDTTVSLPNSLSSTVVDLIEDMTFTNGIEQEMEDVWDKSDEVLLLKLYDKTSNLLDAVWMSSDSLGEYRNYTNKLLKHTLSVYGELNICKLTRGIL